MLEDISTYTVCFCGTDCTREEGEESRPGVSPKEIFCEETGYIPVRIHKQIVPNFSPEEIKATSISIRGVGASDTIGSTDALMQDIDFLKVPEDLSTYAGYYSFNRHFTIFNPPISPLNPSFIDKPINLLWNIVRQSGDLNLIGNAKIKIGDTAGSVRNFIGNKKIAATNLKDAFLGREMAALALHAANKAASSKSDQYNFIGHSRGAVECIMTAWFLYAYGDEKIRNTPINIFAIDPVPGPGDWYGILTQLPPNVNKYVGIYAWDMSVLTNLHPSDLDRGFIPVVPRPNRKMLGKNEPITPDAKWPENKFWNCMADDAQLLDPLQLDTPFCEELTNYKLFACRGRHSTVAGNCTTNGRNLSINVKDEIACVPKLVYKMAYDFLKDNGTIFQQSCSVKEERQDLIDDIKKNHAFFDAMGGGENRTSKLYGRPYVRRISSIPGRNSFNTYYMEDVVGPPPDGSHYPTTSERRSAGWIKWKFL